MGILITEKELGNAISEKVSTAFGKHIDDASKKQIYLATSLVIRDFLMKNARKHAKKSEKTTPGRFTISQWSSLWVEPLV